MTSISSPCPADLDDKNAKAAASTVASPAKTRRHSERTMLKTRRVAAKIDTKTTVDDNAYSDDENSSMDIENNTKLELDIASQLLAIHQEIDEINEEMESACEAYNELISQALEFLKEAQMTDPESLTKRLARFRSVNKKILFIEETVDKILETLGEFEETHPAHDLVVVSYNTTKDLMESDEIEEGIKLISSLYHELESCEINLKEFKIRLRTQKAKITRLDKKAREESFDHLVGLSQEELAEMVETLSHSLMKMDQDSTTKDDAKLKTSTKKRTKRSAKADADADSADSAEGASSADEDEQETSVKKSSKRAARSKKDAESLSLVEAIESAESEDFADEHYDADDADDADAYADADDIDADESEADYDDAELNESYDDEEEAFADETLDDYELADNADEYEEFADDAEGMADSSYDLESSNIPSPSEIYKNPAEGRRRGAVKGKMARNVSDDGSETSSSIYGVPKAVESRSRRQNAASSTQNIYGKSESDIPSAQDIYGNLGKPVIRPNKDKKAIKDNGRDLGFTPSADSNNKVGSREDNKHPRDGYESEDGNRSAYAAERRDSEFFDERYGDASYQEHYDGYKDPLYQDENVNEFSGDPTIDDITSHPVHEVYGVPYNTQADRPMSQREIELSLSRQFVTQERARLKAERRSTIRNNSDVLNERERIRREREEHIRQLRAERAARDASKMAGLSYEESQVMAAREEKEASIRAQREAHAHALAEEANRQARERRAARTERFGDGRDRGLNLPKSLVNQYNQANELKANAAAFGADSRDVGGFISRNQGINHQYDNYVTPNFSDTYQDSSMDSRRPRLDRADRGDRSDRGDRLDRSRMERSRRMDRPRSDRGEMMRPERNDAPRFDDRGAKPSRMPRGSKDPGFQSESLARDTEVMRKFMSIFNNSGDKNEMPPPQRSQLSSGSTTSVVSHGQGYASSSDYARHENSDFYNPKSNNKVTTSEVKVVVRRKRPFNA